MPDTSEDPVDHARTTRQHAGETMKDTRNAPGLIAAWIGVIAFVAGLFGFATGHALVGTVGVILAVVLVAGGLGWSTHTHRKVRRAEQRWHAEHPDVPKEPPTS